MSIPNKRNAVISNVSYESVQSLVVSSPIDGDLIGRRVDPLVAVRLQWRHLHWELTSDSEMPISRLTRVYHWWIEIGWGPRRSNGFRRGLAWLSRKHSEDDGMWAWSTRSSRKCLGWMEVRSMKPFGKMPLIRLLPMVRRKGECVFPRIWKHPTEVVSRTFCCTNPTMSFHKKMPPFVCNCSIPPMGGCAPSPSTR